MKKLTFVVLFALGCGDFSMVEVSSTGMDSGTAEDHYCIPTAVMVQRFGQQGWACRTVEEDEVVVDEGCGQGQSLSWLCGDTRVHCIGLR
jgi:hypothetical protein